MRRNITLDTDAYKPAHPRCMKPGLTDISAYMEARMGAKYPFTSWIGLDWVIAQNLMTVPTNADLEEAKETSFETYGENYFVEEPWKKTQKLGYIPLHIDALPEGMNVPISNALFTYKATEEWFAPVANSLETLLMHPWYPTTISTRVKVIKESLRPLVELSGTIELLDYMVNDFGARGGTWYEAVAVAGAAVLVHGQGSDNLIASRFIKDFYGYKGRAKSIWATEHSVALSFGPGEGEFLYLKHQLENCPINKTLAVVIDTWDSENYMHNIVSRPEIVALIKARSEAGGSVVFRPDSGIPQEQVDMVLEALAGIFGYHRNSKGYKVLNYSVRCIQGDGMTETSIIALYKGIVRNKWSTDNLFVGSGGGLLQVDANRDVQRFAIKPSRGIIAGKEVNFKKSPKTDPTKGSKAGDLKVIPCLGNDMMTISSLDNDPASFASFVDLKKTVFLNGKSFPNKFEDIIERSNRPFGKFYYDV